MENEDKKRKRKPPLSRLITPEERDVIENFKRGESLSANYEKVQKNLDRIKAEITKGGKKKRN